MNLQPTVPPNELKAGHRRCTQIQCSFYQSGHCQACTKGHNCLARPYEINESCQECLSCENVPGYLRFGDEKLQTEMEAAAMKHVAEQQPDGVILIYNDKPSPGHRKQEEEMLR